MPLTLVAPAPLTDTLVASAHLALKLPNLEALLAAASIEAGSKTVDEWLATELGVVIAGEPPVGALRLASEGGESQRDARAGYWLCADPIATTMGTDSIRIDGPVLDLDAEEAGIITRALTEFFAADGLHFSAPAPSRWYVRCDASQQLRTTSLPHAIGASMLDILPSGADAAAWRSRLNEAQMLLHAHPVNRARELGGRLPVASCWWWGGGTWPALQSPRVDLVAGGDRWIATACHENGIAIEPLSAGLAQLTACGTTRVVIVLDDQIAAADSGASRWLQWDSDWFGPLRRALESRAVERATLVVPWFGGSLCLHFSAGRSSIGWRRWFGVAPKAAPTVADALAPYLQ